MTSRVINNKLASILSALKAAQKGSIQEEIIEPYSSAEDITSSEAVMFIKPEGLDFQGGVAVENLISLVGDKAAENGLSIDAISVLSSEYLRMHDIIAAHYGVINRISRHGLSTISEDAHKTLNELFEQDISDGAQILGGHEMLQAFPSLTPKSLDVLIDNIGFKKLAPGTYCTRVKIDGGIVLLLNGFHPYQLEHFTSQGRAIVVFVVRSTKSWKAMRNEFLGSTSPSSATPGSLRRYFYENRLELGIKQVNQGSNVLHLSAGPLEGMVEVSRYFSDYSTSKMLEFSATNFGRLLLVNGFDNAEIRSLAANPLLVQSDRRVSAFDLTEEIDPQEAVGLLHQAKQTS